MRAFCFFLLLAYGFVAIIGGQARLLRICTEASDVPAIDQPERTCCDGKGTSNPTAPAESSPCDHCIDVPFPAVHKQVKSVSTEMVAIGHLAPVFASLLPFVFSTDPELHIRSVFDAAPTSQHPAALISTVVLRC